MTFDNVPVSAQETLLGASFAKVTIAITDADPKGAAIVQSALASLGCKRILRARDGPELLPILAKEQVDLLIIDWTSTTANGIDVVRDIRQDPSSRAREVLVLSARVEREAIETARDAGVNEYLIKPFSTASLLASIHVIAFTPRSFVVSKGYVGPDRRLKSSFTELLPKITGASEREQPGAGTPSASEDRRIELAPISLHERIEEVAACIRSVMAIPGDIESLRTRLVDVAKVIETEASGQGLGKMSEVASLLRGFCETQFVPTNGAMLVLLERYMLTLRSLLEGGMAADAGPLGDSLLKDLRERIKQVTKADRKSGSNG